MDKYQYIVANPPKNVGLFVSIFGSNWRKSMNRKRIYNKHLFSIIYNQLQSHAKLYLLTSSRSPSIHQQYQEIELHQQPAAAGEL